MAEQDDIHYVKQVLAGNTAAFAVLVNRHKDLVFSVALKIVRNREDAEEIAQDSFVKAFQSLRSFKGDSKFSTWMYRIVYNAAISHTRHRKHEFAPLDDFIVKNVTDDEILDDLDRMDTELQKKLVDAAVDKLSPEDGALVTLFYLEEHSIDDISRITGLSVANVKVKLHRIRIKLFDEVQKLIQQEVLV